MKQSESVASLAPALAKAQAELKAIAHDSKNPHFKSSYASLDTILEHVRPILAAQGLSIVQGMTTPHTDEHGKVTAITVETMLLHASGEYLSSAAIMPVAKHDPQGMGGAFTYGRRYGLTACLALATEEDDDGNSASQKGRERTAREHQAREDRPRALAPPGLGDGTGEPPTDEQRALVAKLMKSHVFSEEDRRRVEVRLTSKNRASDAIKWAQFEIAKRKEAETAGAAA